MVCTADRNVSFHYIIKRFAIHCLLISKQLQLPFSLSSLLLHTTMADSASESDTDGAGSSSATPMSSSASNSGKPSIVISQFRLEELTNRLASLQQENKVLKIELETFKLKCKALQEENRDLRKASVTIVSYVSKLTSYTLLSLYATKCFRFCR